MLISRRLLTALVLVTALAGGRPAAAQTTVTSGDLQRLDQSLSEATVEIDRLRTTDSSLASSLSRTAAELRDDIASLRVKLRREGFVSQRDYDDIRGRIDDLRRRAGVTSTTVERERATGVPAGPPVATGDAPDTIDVGTQVDVRLQMPISSKTAKPEDRFEATTVVDLYKGGRLLVPAGSTLMGVVTSVTPAGRVNRKGKLRLAFDELVIDQRRYPIRATVLDALESEGIAGEVGRIGTAAGIGAMIGGIIGGAKGALIGILIGGGGTIAATEGKDVSLPPGTILRVQLDSAVTVPPLTRR
jgi:hypothetical protein